MKLLTWALASSLLCSTLTAQETKFQFTHDGSILHLKFSPSGSKLLSYSSGNQDLGLWDVSTGRLLWIRPISFIRKADEYYTLDSFAWSSDETFVATGSANGTVQLWNARDGQFIWRADVSKGDVTALAFSPDDRIIAATDYDAEGPAATLLDVSQGTVVKTLAGNKCPAIAIAFSGTGNGLSIGNLNGNVVRWDLSTGTPTNQVECKGSYAYGGERTFSQDLSLSVRRTTAEEIVIEESNGSVIKELKLDDSKLRALVNSRARKAVIEEYSGYRLHDLSNGSDYKMKSCGNPFDLSDDGRFFAQSCDGFKTSIKVTDLTSGKSWLLDGHPSKINALAYSPDFSLLAVAGNDGNAYLFDPATRTLKRILAGNGSRLTSLAFTPDGKQVITGDEDTGVHRWSVADGSILQDALVADDRADDIEKIEISSNGKDLLLLINSEIVLLDSSLNVRGSLRTPEDFRSSSGTMTYTYSYVPANSAAFSPAGTKVVTAHRDGTIRFWNTSSLAQLKSFKVAESVQFVAPIDDRRLLAIANLGEKVRFYVLDSNTGKSIKCSTAFDAGHLEKMFLSPDKRLAVVTNISGNVIICDLATMTLRNFDNGLSGEDSVAFSSDSKTFFIGGENQNLSLYDSKSLRKHWTLLPEFVPSSAETRMEEERDRRVIEINKRKETRGKEGAAFVRANRNKVYVTFDHYGDASHPGEKRLMERSELNESKQSKRPDEATAVWLRLHNDSTLPIKVPTQSMYMPDLKCFHQFPTGEKLHGLCKDREIAVWFGVRDRKNKPVPYGFDFGSSIILLPGSSTIFPIPINIWSDGYSIVFDYSFQNLRASENDDNMDFGPDAEIVINKSTVRKP